MKQIGFTPSNSISHVGPLMVYMAKAPGDPSDWNGAGQVWFKINEWSPDFSTGSINWPQLGENIHGLLRVTPEHCLDTDW